MIIEVGAGVGHGTVWGSPVPSRTGVCATVRLVAKVSAPRGTNGPCRDDRVHRTLEKWRPSGPPMEAVAGMNADGNGADRETRVLVVEDDRGIAESLVRGLRQAGYVVDGVGTGRAALSSPTPDVVLLDLGLPDIDGIEVCRMLRARSDAVIIAVTARGEEADRVVALDEGADDYLVKPFGLAELLARIRAVLRRRRPAGPEVVRHGPLALDLRTRQVSVDGRAIALTPKEFGILECLAADPGRVVSRQQILERAWDAHWYGPTKVLDVHIAALRRKLGVPGLVETVYGHGFRLGAPGDPP